MSDSAEVEKKKAKIESKSGAKRKSTSEVEEQPKKSKVTAKKLADDGADSDGSAKYFKSPKPVPKLKAIEKLVNESKIDRRILSSDSENEAGPKNVSPSKKSKGIDIWVELYSEKDARWIAIDILKGKIDCVEEICKAATHPMVYVFAFNNDNSVKDVSARYCPNLNTTVRKMRVDSAYLDAVIGRYEGIKTSRDVKEDDELNKLQLQKPMPTSIAE